MAGNEKRLIDANELAEQVDNLCADWNENWIGNDNQSFILHSDVSDLISDAPTVDAVEVVHGEWSRLEDDYCGIIALVCSECNREYWFEDEPPMKIYNYCPNCGAKMDGDRNDN